jgi:hypothetical protein
MSPTIEIPFVLNGKSGRLAVEYKANDDVNESGFDLLAGAFDPRIALGYPTMHGRFVAYEGSGYRTACGWIQVIRSAFYDDLAADEPVACDTEADLAGYVHEGGVPFFAFGYLPDIYDAPANNLREFARMSWQADTFLVTMPARWNDFSIACLAAYRWGYWDALVEGAHQVELLPLEVLDRAAWAAVVPMLAAEFPRFTFRP